MTSNRDLSKRFIDEVINGRRLSVIDETVAEDFVYIDSTIGTVKGRDSLKELFNRSLLPRSRTWSGRSSRTFLKVTR